MRIPPKRGEALSPQLLFMILCGSFAAVEGPARQDAGFPGSITPNPITKRFDLQVIGNYAILISSPPQLILQSPAGVSSGPVRHDPRPDASRPPSPITGKDLYVPPPRATGRCFAIQFHQNKETTS